VHDHCNMAVDRKWRHRAMHEVDMTKWPAASPCKDGSGMHEPPPPCGLGCAFRRWVISTCVEPAALRLPSPLPCQANLAGWLRNSRSPPVPPRGNPAAGLLPPFCPRAGSGLPLPLLPIRPMEENHQPAGELRILFCRLQPLASVARSVSGSTSLSSRLTHAHASQRHTASTLNGPPPTKH